MTNLEMVEMIREKAGISYEEAKDALERNNWDMLDAMIDLERRGRVSGAAGSASYTRTEESSGNTYRQVDPTASEGRTEESKGHFLLNEFKKLAHKGMENSLIVSKDGKMLFCLPVLVFVLLVLFAFWVVIPLMVIGMAFGFHYSFEGADLGKPIINDTIEKAADYVNEAADKFRGEQNKNEQN